MAVQYFEFSNFSGNIAFKLLIRLSQAFARNITILENIDGISIGFIDFEDDPLETMSLENAQARDLLLIYSLSKYFDNCQKEYQALVTAQIKPLPENIKQQLRRFVSKFGWLGKLPGKRRFGNGYWRLTTITDVLRLGLEKGESINTQI